MFSRYLVILFLFVIGSDCIKNAYVRLTYRDDVVQFEKEHVPINGFVYVWVPGMFDADTRTLTLSSQDFKVAVFEEPHKDAIMLYGMIQFAMLTPKPEVIKMSTEMAVCVVEAECRFPQTMGLVTAEFSQNISTGATVIVSKRILDEAEWPLA